MSSLVPAEEIQRIVGVDRHLTEHWARAVSAEQEVYILHSKACADSGIDLRECEYSVTLDRHGIDLGTWRGHEDRPVRLQHGPRGELVPAIRRCRGRCWFSVYGHPGLRSPVCVRCGRPNPKPLTEDEQAEYSYWKANRNG